MPLLRKSKSAADLHEEAAVAVHDVGAEIVRRERASEEMRMERAGLADLDAEARRGLRERREADERREELRRREAENEDGLERLRAEHGALLRQAEQAARAEHAEATKPLREEHSALTAEREQLEARLAEIGARDAMIRHRLTAMEERLRETCARYNVSVSAALYDQRRRDTETVRSLAQKPATLSPAVMGGPPLEVVPERLRPQVEAERERRAAAARADRIAEFVRAIVEWNTTYNSPYPHEVPSDIAAAVMERLPPPPAA